MSELQQKWTYTTGADTPAEAHEALVKWLTEHNDGEILDWASEPYEKDGLWLITIVFHERSKLASDIVSDDARNLGE